MARRAGDSQLKVHRIILATGYRPNMRNVAFLDCATILDPLATVDGFPALAPEFQTNLPNLYITGLAATRDFGPFFSLTAPAPSPPRSSAMLWPPNPQGLRSLPAKARALASTSATMSAVRVFETEGGGI
jgi:hypothetical protein